MANFGWRYRQEAGEWDGSLTGNATIDGTISGSSTLRLGTSLSASADVAVTGSVHANKFYGDGSNLTGISSTPTSLSGTTAQLTTGVETSGYLKVTGSSTLGALTATTYSGSSTIQSVGKAYFGHNVYITGGVQAQALVVANAGIMSTTYSGSSTLQAVGNVVLGGTLNVTGNTSVRGNIASTNGNISTDNGNISVGGAGSWNKGPNGGLAISGYMSGSTTLRLGTSLSASGDVAVTGSVHANKFYGDGSGLTSVTADWGGTTTNAISGSSTLQVVGNTILGGSAHVSGALRAKQIHIIDHHFFQSATAKRFIPFTYQNEATNPSWETMFVAPFNGRLVRFMARCAGNGQDGDVTIGVHTASNGTALVDGEYTSEFQVETVDVATNTTFTVDFTGSQHFTAGQGVGVSWDIISNPGYCALTTIWEFDMTGLPIV
jgi:hypothetical protein